MRTPVVVMVAGPNGAGKSSIAPGLLARSLGVSEYVNADVIARGISGFDVDGAAVAAGRIMLARLDELAVQGRCLHSKRPAQAAVSRRGSAGSRQSAIHFSLCLFGWTRPTFGSTRCEAGRAWRA